MEWAIAQGQNGPCALCGVAIRRYGEGASTLCTPCTGKLVRMRTPFEPDKVEVEER